jgi:NAD(P)-dependent dehydrogenase (short-subunit alcohol dehydrogenase family)
MHVTQATPIDEHPLMRPGGFDRLRGKVAIVTGADSGMGRATARLFAREGARVVCVDIWESGAPRIDRLIQQEGGEAAFIQGDAGERDTWQHAVATALDQFGGLHVLFSHAGVGARGKIHELSDDDWNRVVSLNLNGIRYAAQAAIPHFLAQHEGNIVITASTHGAFGVPDSAAYCATKAALINLTREMALDYGPDIRVNCICPGPIDTPGLSGWPPHPSRDDAPGGKQANDARRVAQVRGLHRQGSPEEIAYAVLFLACNESSFITGHPLIIDGGQTISTGAPPREWQ